MTIWRMIAVDDESQLMGSPDLDNMTSNLNGSHECIEGGK